MNLVQLKIRNFRGYKEETIIPISDLTGIIGKNDAGKSTILEALEIFFNNKIVVMEKDDLSKGAADNNIEITCVFENCPVEIVIDAAAPTTLADEHLLNSDGNLEIKKIYKATTAKPKPLVHIVCDHPTAIGVENLLSLKRNELKAKATGANIDPDTYNANINSSIRKVLWDFHADLIKQPIELLIDKEDTKKVYDTLSKSLPLYALFQSDRSSKDDDKEVADPMKIAVQKALAELEEEVEKIKTEVRNKAIETANRTLAKLNEINPELAKDLIPEFKTEPKFDSLFKLTINSEDEIPINKRGSGVRRLILLNFFRAEAERKLDDGDSVDIIYAFEEPETSQHPDHQELLIEAFITLSSLPSTQILLTTHTPALAGLLPLDGLRYVESISGNRTVESGTDDVFEKIANALGVLPDPISKNATALMLVEGKSDVTFINHTANELKGGGFIQETFEDRNFAIVPIGGCGNLKHWRILKLADQFQIPYCVLLDSDKGTPEEPKNLKAINAIKAQGAKAYLTRKREPENYILNTVLGLPAGTEPTYTETCDAKVIIGLATTSRKVNVIENYWVRMNCAQIREAEKYVDGGVEKFEFTEMFLDLLTI